MLWLVSSREVFGSGAVFLLKLLSGKVLKFRIDFMFFYSCILHQELGAHRSRRDTDLDVTAR